MLNNSATLANVASSATSVTLFSDNGGARLRTIFNDSTAVLYVKWGTTASTTSYTVQIAAGGYFEFPRDSNGRIYSGRVDGIWSAANGNARCTET